MYYRFLHPSDHVRLNTKHNLQSIVRIRPIPRINRMKKSKSCEEMIDQNNDFSETISLQLNSNSINERWYNRFSKENRQKLISQQQAIDQKVKLTRAQEQLERQQNSPNRILKKLSATLKLPASTPTDSITDGHSFFF